MVTFSMVDLLATQMIIYKIEESSVHCRLLNFLKTIEPRIN